MKKCFADTGYWIALINSDDVLHGKAKSISEGLAQIEIVTTSLVLVEVLDGLSTRGEHKRRLGQSFVELLQADRGTTVLEATDDFFADAFQLWCQRTDKNWTLTDCSSFATMSKLSIADALAYDHHFIQAGFNAMLRNV